jgi:MoaA/NifB/PqqE/SkfB family radical SAM enzyme
LEPRPFGGFNRTCIDDIFSSDSKKRVNEFFINSMHNKKYKKYPIIYYVAEIESKNKMGCCMGGLSHFYIDCKGNVNPCVFLPVTFGNILRNQFEDIYVRMRSVFPKPLKCRCPSLLIGENLIDKGNLRYPIHIDSLNEKLNTFSYSELLRDDPVI